MIPVRETVPRMEKEMKVGCGKYEFHIHKYQLQFLE